MCGIAGIIAFTEKGKTSFVKMAHAIQCLGKRGPDANGTFTHNRVALGHARLSVIDTSSAGAQPMTDASGRYTIIFNGEFFNFKEHRKFVEQSVYGKQLKSDSDTEVLLYLYMLEKEECLKRVNGFFALAIYDKQEETLFLARDRFGVKPLLIYQDENALMFASEMKALMALGIPRVLDDVSLFTYLQLNYIPGPGSIFRGVRKLEPGCWMVVRSPRSTVDGRQLEDGSTHFAVGNQKSNVSTQYPILNTPYSILNSQYFQIPFPSKENRSLLTYEDQQRKLVSLLDASVQRRLVSDVPLGAFLSGGIDSSVIVALASRHTQHLNTFSIGFRDEPMFDETQFANLVAKKCNTSHTVFSLTNDDLFDHLFKALDYLDEPFADSSALAVYILSKLTRQHATVALSGDGADELFGGYNKHAAELKIRSDGIASNAIRLLGPLWKILPQSRNSTAGNRIRQLDRFALGAKLSAKDRYWRWAGFQDESSADAFLINKVFSDAKYREEYSTRKRDILQFIHEDGDVNDVLYTDMKFVLPNDMLTKVDMMSMANSLEVRTPFLDYEVVDFAFSLPLSSKIDGNGRKTIVRDAFRNQLPEELYTRRKQGFEVPLLPWFRKELKPLITDDLLSEKLIREQNIFNPEAIRMLKAKLFSNNPGEAVAQVWALIVFQHWWKRTMIM